MSERRQLSLTVGLVVVAALAVVLALVIGRSSAAASRPTGSPRPAAAAFAAAYVRVLEGRLSAARLPDADPAVRTSAARAGERIAGGATIGGTVWHYVRGASTAQAQVDIAAGTRVAPFDIDLVLERSRWRVSHLVAPDLGTALATPRPQRAVSAAARGAGARFAVAYADARASGHASALRALPTLKRQIASDQDPLAGLAPDHLRAHLRSLRFAPAQGRLAVANAAVSIGGAVHRFSFIMRRTGGAWRGWWFEGSGE